MPSLSFLSIFESLYNIFAWQIFGRRKCFSKSPHKYLKSERIILPFLLAAGNIMKEGDPFFSFFSEGAKSLPRGTM